MTTRRTRCVTISHLLFRQAHRGVGIDHRVAPRGRQRAPYRLSFEELEERSLWSTFTVLNVNDSGAGSLRQAILSANARPGNNTIAFAISTGVQTIKPLSPLPAVTNPVSIDGTTQGGFAGMPLIVLDGALAGANANGLTITAGNSVVRDLVINRFSGNAIELDTAGNNLIAGNYLGTDPTGTLARSNSGYGIAVNSGSGNTIGGTTSGAGNVISANGQGGIHIAGSSLLVSADNNVVRVDGVTGTVLATDATGVPNDAVVTGPDGSLYVTDYYNNQVLHYDAAGNLLAAFGAGHLNEPQDLVFGPDGNLYVGNAYDGSVTQFSASGAFLSTFVTAGSGGISNAKGLVFGPNGNLYVADLGSGSVLSYSGLNGAFLGAFVPRGSGGLTYPEDLQFGPDGSLYVTDYYNNTVDRYDGTSGAFLGAVINGGNLSTPYGLRFDAAGHLDVACRSLGAIQQYNPTTGAFLGTLASGLTNPAWFTTLTGSGSNTIEGNYVGTNATGTLALGNRQQGMVVSGSAHNSIGGSAAGSGNVLSANAGDGLDLVGSASTGNLVQGNLIGTNAGGNAALANGGNGGVVLYQGASNNTIGGTSAGARNLISGNTASGLNLLDQGTTGNLVQGNYVGTDITGKSAIANRGNAGIVLAAGASNNTIGGTSAAAGNLVSGNSGDGINLQDSGTTGNLVQGNNVGTDVTGAAPLANAGNDGVLFYNGASANTLGGTTPGAGNIIAYNRNPGVGVLAPSAQDAILGNAIYGNGGLGIDLGADGVTTNTGGESAALPNVGMNFPVFTSATTNGAILTVAGYVGSAAGQSAFAGARVELYQSDGNPSGYGAGQTYLGYLIADANGNINGSVTVNSLKPGDKVTGTATDAAGNTSEFAANVSVGGGGVSLLASTTTVSSSLNPVVYGQAVTFTATATGLGLPPLTGGSVTFMDGGTNLGTVSLNGATASVTVSTLAAGSHNIVAYYNGNLVYGPSASSELAQTVTPAILTVTANNASKVYGQANPGFTDIITGFVNGDRVKVVHGSASLTTTATAASGVGGYTIMAAQGSLSADNYTFTFVNGTLTVTPALLTVTANDTSRTYGQANPTFTYSVTGFVNGDTASVLGGSPSLTTAATKSSPVGAYTITASQHNLNATNYTFTFVNGTLTITPATLTITANNASKVYGQANPVFTDSITGFLNGDNASVVSGSANVTTTATAASGVGTYPVTAGPGTLSAANYTFAFVNGTLSVTPATLTVTDNQSKVYGAALPTLTASYSGFINGDGPAVISGSASLATNATASSHVGAYTILVAQGSLVAANYLFACVNGALTVTPATLIVTANNASKVFGQANPTFADTITGFVNGDSATVVSGSAGLRSTATSSSGVGSYPITAALGTLSAANYTFAFASGALAITPAQLTVTANNASKVYGQPNPTFTGLITGFVNGDSAGVVSGSASLTTTATARSSVGSYPITAALGTLGAANYSFTFTGGTLTVTPALLTVRANNASQTYGQVNPALNASYSGFVNGDTASVLSGSPGLTTTATTNSGVGSYPITASQGTLGAANYTFAFVSGTLTVNAAVLTVSAHNINMVYGSAVPAFTDTITGFVNGDTPTVVSGSASLTTNATSSSGVGSYPITAGVGTLSAANYIFTFVRGSLNITPATLTVTANDASKVYGQANPMFGVSITGYVNGDTASVVSGAASLTTTATSASGVGSYPIAAALGTLGAVNYVFAFTGGTLTVTPATLTVTANNASMVQGDALPTFTASYSGFVSGDTPASLGGGLNFSTPATPTSPVGTYWITPGGLTSTNYTIAFANGTLTIIVIALNSTSTVVTTSGSPAVYGQSVTFTATVSDTSGGSGTPTGSVTYADGSNTVATVRLIGNSATFTTSALAAGDHAITATYRGDASFAASTSSTLTQSVTPAALTVTAHDANKVYGHANPGFTVSYTGFVNGDGPGALDGSLSFSTPATTSSPVGSYAITPSGLTSSNYAITYVAGHLSVTPATLTVTANDARVIYGATLPTLGVSYNGFINGDTPAVLSGSPVLSTTATSQSGVGSYAITARPGTLSAANYDFTFVAGTLTVTPAKLTVTATDATTVYGLGVPSLNATITGYRNGDTASIVSGNASLSTTATNNSGAGGYPIVAALGTLSAANYTFAFVDGTLTVTPATLTVTASDLSKVYGQPNPTFTDTITGFVNGDAASVVTGAAGLTTTATTQSGVGSLPIIASQGSLAAANYLFAFVNGTLTVTPASLTVAASDVSRVYGQANPPCTATITGFVNGDSAAVVHGDPSLQTGATRSSDVGAYIVTAAPGTLQATNYVFTFIYGTLTITPATLTVAVGDVARVFGDENPAFSATITGFVNGDNASVVSGSADLATPATPDSAAGDYPITVGLGTLSAANYAFAFVNGTLTVAPAPASSSPPSPPKPVTPVAPVAPVTSSTSFVPPAAPSSTLIALPVALAPPVAVAAVSTGPAASAASAPAAATSAAVILAASHSASSSTPVAAEAARPVAPPASDSASPAAPAIAIAPPAPPPTTAPLATAPLTTAPAQSSPTPASLLITAPGRVSSAAPFAGVLQTDVLWGELDEFQPQIESSPVNTVLTVGVVTSLLTSAGYLVFSARASYWLLTLLLARPLMWKRFDPMEVLFAWEKEKERRRANGQSERDEQGESLASLVRQG